MGGVASLKSIGLKLAVAFGGDCSLHLGTGATELVWAGTGNCEVHLRSMVERGSKVRFL